MTKLINKRTEEQKADLKRAQQAGIFREIALNNGGTGELRRNISSEEFAKKKARRKIARASRKRNRKGV